MRERYQVLLDEIREDYVRSSNHDDADWDEAVKDEGDLSVADTMADLNAQRLDQCRVELNELRRALEKIADGSYGECEECGQPIDPRRLEVNPTSRWCITDASRIERNTRHAQYRTL